MAPLPGTACDRRLPRRTRLQVYGAGLADPEVAVVHAPLALLPARYPRGAFLAAKAAATTFNSLVDAVAGDDAYLAATLEPAARHDAFTVRRRRPLGGCCRH
jgi:hypothetical protein